MLPFSSLVPLRVYPVLLLHTQIVFLKLSARCLNSDFISQVLYLDVGKSKGKIILSNIK